MKWEKLGKIFDPSDHILADGFSSFAKSPQALVFDDFIRIYFCAQKLDANGKYLSCPKFVDFNKSFSRVLEVSDKPIIELGNLGEFDEHGIFPFNPLFINGAVWGFTSGWSRRISVSIDMAIGLAISTDGGRYFNKHGSGGPILSAALNEPFLVGDPYVKLINNQFHMWYIFGTNWVRKKEDGEAERFYKIAHATSADGIEWLRDGLAIIPDAIEDECQALPTIFQRNGRYHMYFCFRKAYDFRQNTANGYRLGYAYSDDLTHWHRDDSQSGLETSSNGWDSQMMCYPNTFECDNEIFMLYNGNEFGRHGFGLAKLIST